MHLPPSHVPLVFEGRRPYPAPGPDKHALDWNGAVYCHRTNKTPPQHHPGQPTHAFGCRVSHSMSFSDVIRQTLATLYLNTNPTCSRALSQTSSHTERTAQQRPGLLAWWATVPFTRQRCLETREAHECRPTGMAALQQSAGYDTSQDTIPLRRLLQAH